MKKFLTSESVNIGHPDKTCDTIADSFLDEALRQDKDSQMAVECAIKNNVLMVYGEATTRANIDYKKIAREVLKDIGYKNKFKVKTIISEQSRDINQAVVQEELNANDQGMVYGYASNETKEYMPMPIIISHKLMKKYDEYRRQNDTKYFADAKSQVTIEYNNDKPSRIDTVLVSVSHNEVLDKNTIENDIISNVIDPVLAEYKKYIKGDIKYIVNPSGKFTIWGSFGDSGCVGRKIVVDTYGGIGRVGGGCFSSKNATKVDRSAAYYARYVAKNIVAHKLADKCEIQVAYAIGYPDPVSIDINTFGTEKVSISEIEKFVNKNFNFRTGNIIKELDLLRPIYKATACYGHFGREEFPWEQIKKIK